MLLLLVMEIQKVQFWRKCLVNWSNGQYPSPHGQLLQNKQARTSTKQGIGLCAFGDYWIFVETHFSAFAMFAFILFLSIYFPFLKQGFDLLLVSLLYQGPIKMLLMGHQ